MVLIQLTEEDELRWDDGTAHPEYCLDQFNLVGRVRCSVAQTSVLSQQACKIWFDRVPAQWDAVGMLAAGLGIFGLVAGAASYNNKASRMPYVRCWGNFALLCHIHH